MLVEGAVEERIDDCRRVEVLDQRQHVGHPGPEVALVDEAHELGVDPVRRNHMGGVAKDGDPDLGSGSRERFGEGTVRPGGTEGRKRLDVTPVVPGPRHEQGLDRRPVLRRRLGERVEVVPDAVVPLLEADVHAPAEPLVRRRVAHRNRTIARATTNAVSMGRADRVGVAPSSVDDRSEDPDDEHC
ncbi:MAG: hypothetical protein V9G12_03395 [Microthrixaceae bacterium]